MEDTGVCDKVVKLSPIAIVLPLKKEVVSNVHGVEFF
jgi:hypothetical protein